MFKEAIGKKMVFGLIHLKPLPSTPFFKEGDIEASIEKAVHDAQALEAGGADGCLVQSVDRVYPATDDTDYARVATIAVITNEVKRVVSSDFKVGVQLMWNCITPSIAAAKAGGAVFTRCSALIGKTDSPFGTIEANPNKVMSYRKNIGAESVDLIAEIAGYHFLGDYSKDKIVMLAHQALTIGADAVEVYHKDEQTNNRMVADIKEAFPGLPVVLGGGTNIENVTSRMKLADVALVGKCFENDNWGGNIDVEAVKRYVENLRKI